MLKDKFKMTTQDKKIVDVNDFWLIPDNPMTKIGVFPYLGRQISPELEPDKIYQVLRPKEELTRPETLESLKLIPLINDHTMLGTAPGMTPADDVGVEGTTGTNVKVSGQLITNDLKCYTENIKDLISSGKKDLSMGYRCRYELTEGEFEGQHYDAIQRDIIFNHIALVDEGRMGSDVRVMDSFTFDSITDLTKTKEKNMADENKDTQAQDIDKREILREADAIAMKPASEFEGGAEEKFRTLTKKLEELSYDPSETGANDEDIEPVEANIKEGEDEDDNPDKPCEDEDTDENKPAEDEDEDKPCGDEDPEKKEGEDEDEEEKPVSMDSAIKYLAKRDRLISKLRPVIGDNSKYSSMTIKQVVKYACDKLDLKNSLDALEGYLKAKSQSRVRVSMDSAFNAPSESSVLRQYKKQK